MHLTKNKSALVINNGNETEWSPIRSVIIRVITKSYDREAGVQFVNHLYDHRLKGDELCDPLPLVILFYHASP